MKAIRWVLISLVLLAAPLTAAAADDSNISALSVTVANELDAGASASYSLQISFAEAMSGTSEDPAMFTLYARAYPEGSPLGSGFDFTDTTVIDTSGWSDTTVGSSPAVGVQVFSTSGFSATSYVFGLDSLTNPSTSGCYQFIATTAELPSEGSDFTGSDVFSIGGGSCLDEPQVDLAAESFGENVALSWDAVEGADSYAVYYSSVSVADVVDPDSATNTLVEVGEGTSVTLDDLSPNTTYYVLVHGVEDGVDEVLAGSEPLTVMTGKKISNTRAAKPTILKKQRTRKKVTVKWEAPETVAYVKKYKMQVYKKTGKTWKKVRTYKKIDDDKTKKVVKKLKPATTYRVRMRTVYDTGDATKWSKYSKPRKTKP